MSKVTICPHFLLNYSQTSPNDIEQSIILPLYNCVKECLNNKLPIIISKEILVKFQESYPWNLLADNAWKGYILNWHALITSKITNHCEIISVAGRNDSDQLLCRNFNNEINKLFIVFLDEFASKNLPGNLSEEGIISSDSCIQAIEHTKCHPVTKPEEIIKVKYPWLRVYNKPLPPEGECAFIPPINWKNNVSPVKGCGNGFLDKNGVEWIWDKLHKDHWDVQDGTPYKNVNPEGKIL